MQKLIFISGACGSGKSTLTDAYARHLVDRDRKTAYVIHGDDFHQGFVEVEDKEDFFVNGQPSDGVLWEDILRFNWDCILATADRALKQGMDVLIDYVIETELPRVKALAAANDAAFYYIVLTASEAALEARIRGRGDLDMIDRARFLKKQLESLPDNQGHLYDNTHKSVTEIVRELELEQFRVFLS